MLPSETFGPDDADEDRLLGAARRLEDDALDRDRRGDRLDERDADLAVGLEQADRAALAALGHEPARAGVEVALHLVAPAAGVDRPGCLRADLGEDLELAR